MARLAASILFVATIAGCGSGDAARTELLGAIEKTLAAPSYRVQVSSSTDGSDPIDTTIERSGSRARLSSRGRAAGAQVSIGRATYIGGGDANRGYKRVRGPRGSAPAADSAAALLQTIIRYLESAEREDDVLTYRLFSRKVDLEASGTRTAAGSATVRDGRIVLLTHRERISFSDAAGEGSSVTVRRFRFAYVRVPAITAPPADLVGN